MEIMRNGLIGDKFCKYCDSVIRIEMKDLARKPFVKFPSVYWTCPVCGRENSLIRDEE